MCALFGVSAFPIKCDLYADENVRWSDEFSFGWASGFVEIIVRKVRLMRQNNGDWLVHGIFSIASRLG